MVVLWYASWPFDVCFFAVPLHRCTAVPHGSIKFRSTGRMTTGTALAAFVAMLLGGCAVAFAHADIHGNTEIMLFTFALLYVGVPSCRPN